MTASLQAPAAAAGYATAMDEMPDPQVPARAKRRTFTKQYKLRVLREYDAASPTQRVALMRREALYSSHISEWRKQRDDLASGMDRKRGRPARDARDVEIEKLKRDNARLADKLAKAETVIDV